MRSVPFQHSWTDVRKADVRKLCNALWVMMSKSSFSSLQDVGSHHNRAAHSHGAGLDLALETTQAL